MVAARRVWKCSVGWPARVRVVLSGLAPAPLANEGWPGYELPLTEGVDEDAVLGMWVAGGDGATGAHSPRLSPVPLPRVRQAVQRALRHSAEPDAIPL